MTGKENNKSTCSICSNRLHGFVGVMSPCGHVVHAKCYQNVQPPEGQTRKCPQCKKRAVSFTKLALRLPFVVSPGYNGVGTKPTAASTAPADAPPLFLEEPQEDYSQHTGSRGNSSGNNHHHNNNSHRHSNSHNHYIGSHSMEDREGCFVYKALKVVFVRKGPSVDKKYEISQDSYIRKNELVAVDRVCYRRSNNHSSSSNNRSSNSSESDGDGNGPFLRLADGSGWIFERRKGELCMKEMLVEQGMWKFVADNYPSGIALRTNPADHGDNFIEPPAVFHPMQRIVCDRRVRAQDGADYYRVQGTDGWVFDKREDTFMMLPESSVTKGLFVYRAKTAMAIRSDTSVGDGQMTSFSVAQDELIAVDVIRKSPIRGSTNGPFLRLTDGSGWLFEYKQSEQMLEQLRVEKGSWSFRIGSEGMFAYRQPVDSQDFKSIPETQYNPDDIVDCDRKVRAPDGVNFYRVEGSDFWVFDRRGSREMLSKMKSNGKRSKKNGQIAWDVTSVRKIATEVGGLTEIGVNAESRVISFRTKKGVRINVYYTTRTIGTAMDHPIGGKTQLFRKNCTNDELRKTFANPRAHTGRGCFQSSLSKRARLTESGLQTNNNIQPEEDSLRASLQSFEEEIALLNRRRLQVLRHIKEREEEESSEARKHHNKILALQEAGRVDGTEEDVDEDVAAKLLQQQKRGNHITQSIYFSAEIELEGSAQLIALGGEATLMLDERFEARRTRCLPNDIFWLLQSSEPEDPKPVYVALGSDERFFIKYDNGSAQWSEGKCDDFDDIIFNDDDVKFVAFGQSWDSYIVVTSTNIHHNNVPPQIVKILRGTRAIHSISLGPSGEYFVAWEDGSFKGGGWSNQLNNKLGELKRDGWHVRDIKFGAIDTYVVRYSKYSGPF